MNEQTIPELEVRPLPPLHRASEQVLAAARAEADQIKADAVEAASRTRLAAQADVQAARRDAAEAANDRAQAARSLDQARRTLEEAEEKTAKAEHRKALTDKWGPRFALGAAVTLTASGEFALATLSGWPWFVAWALPMSIDVYVVQAFRRHRDVAGALILMVAANALYHLAAAGLVGVHTSGAHKGEPLWWLIVGVAAIAPWVMWRIHRITDERPTERPDAHAQAPTETLTARPAERAQDDAHERPTLNAHAHDSAHPSAQQALTQSVYTAPMSARHERAQSALTHGPTSVDERPVSARRDRPMSAKKTPKSAPKNKAQHGAHREDEIVRDLYDTLNRRPQWTEIRDALVSAKLADPKASRSTMQRIRDRVERANPALAARGSENVRALAPTGTDR